MIIQYNSELMPIFNQRWLEVSIELKSKHGAGVCRARPDMANNETPRRNWIGEATIPKDRSEYKIPGRISSTLFVGV